MAQAPRSTKSTQSVSSSAKSSTSGVSNVSNKSNKPSKSLIPEKYHDALYCGALLLAVVVFLRQTLFGAGFFNASDNIASGSFVTYLQSAKDSGSFPLWIPYIFSGMPSYAALLTTGDRWWDVVMTLFTAVTAGFGGLFGSDTMRVGSYYVLYGIGVYALVRAKTHERFAAFFAAFAAVFSTWIIVWVMIGHNTKPWAIATFPYILLCLEKLRERFTRGSLLYVALLIVAVHVLVESTHIQMAFYGACCFALYIAFELAARLLKRESVLGVLRSAAILAVAGGLAVGMAADRYLSVMEYTPYSTRGTAPIEKAAGNKQDASGGNDYDYATNWSFSPQEMLTFVVPNYFGFGKMEYKGELSQGRATRDIPTYWGQMPFTDAANYMGIGVLLLAAIGAVRHWRNTFVQFLLALAAFSLLLSFGRTFPLLYDLFFYHVPSFNKFRAPQMALALLQFAVPVLSGFGIASLLAWRGLQRQSSSQFPSHSSLQESPQNLQKAQQYTLYGTLAVAAFLLGGVIFNVSGEQMYLRQALGSEHGRQIEAQAGKEAAQMLYKFVYAQAASDWLTTGALGVACMLVVWLFLRGTLSKSLMYAGLALLLVIDLWRVDMRPMDVSKDNLKESVFRRNDVVDFLKQDKSLFRIIDFTVPPNAPAYFELQHAQGYHSAKLRVYQDLLDVAGKGGGSAIANPFLWNLLNVKYLVTDRPLGETMQPVLKSAQTQSLVYDNPSALPRAFFVNRVEVASQMNILEHLRDGDFTPLETAYIEQPLKQGVDTLAGELVQNIERVKILDFKNEHIALEATATGNNLLFLSEVYYPAGWSATIDGKPTDIIKANYAFRAVVVPSGKHRVEFHFTSKNFTLGKNLSLAGNVLTLALLIVGTLLWWQERRASGAASGTQSDL
jgi:hypothetical protein